MSPRARKKWIPLVADEEWSPMKTPCVSPELNRDGPEPDPRVVLLIELPDGSPKAKYGDAHAIRLTADEADAIAADLIRQAAACRANTNARERP